MLVLVLVMFVIMPQLSLLLAQSGDPYSGLSDAIAILERCNKVLMHTLVYAYVFFFGSCIASFLNVVAWRVPRGRSILGSSHCPACDHKLSMKDNIPIWGWLKNEGQCRHCKSSIAQRYLWVEVLLGCVFLVLFLAEIVCAGFNLPTAPDLHYTGIEFVLFAPNAQLIQTFAFHATLMSILFTVAMIASESFPIPRSFIAIAGLILVAIAFFCPVVLQVSWQALPRAPANGAFASFGINSLLTMVLGSVAGVAAGFIGSFIPSSGAKAVRPVSRQQLIACFALVGLALGWQSVVVTLLIWLLLSAVSRTNSDSNAGNSCPTDQSLGTGPNADHREPNGLPVNCNDSRQGGFLRRLAGPAYVMGAALLHILSWSLIFHH